MNSNCFLQLISAILRGLLQNYRTHTCMEFQLVQRNVQKEKKNLENLLESNNFALSSLYSTIWSKRDLKPLLVCDGY